MNKGIRNRIIGILIFCAVATTAIWWGMRPYHRLYTLVHPWPRRAPVTDIRLGIRVTCEQINAHLSPDRKIAIIDTIITVERLDGRDWCYDPMLRTALTCAGFPSGATVSPSAMIALTGHRVRRYHYWFTGLPSAWKDATFYVTLVREIPRPDFDLGTVGSLAPPHTDHPRIIPGHETAAALYTVPDYDRPLESKGYCVGSIGLREGLPRRLITGDTMVGVPTYGHLVVRTDNGAELPSQGVSPRERTSRGGIPPGAYYEISVPHLPGTSPGPLHVQFISTDAMVGDSIQFVLPKVTTIHAVR